MTTLSSAPLDFVRRILRSPPARVLVLGFILVMMMGLNTDVTTSYAAEPAKAAQHIVSLAIAGFAVYLGFAHFIEQRAASELSLPGMGKQFGAGLLIGAGLYTACELILMGLGIYRIDGLNPLSYMLPAIAMALSSSVFEELLFRGVLFLSVEKWFGSWVALVVSSLVFGLTHLVNPQATIEGALFIAVEAGVLLAAALMLTRRLWLCIGFHMAWNYTQSAIFSGIVSGNEAEQGLIRSTMKGPDWLTGGNFGVESSVLSLVPVHHDGHRDAGHGGTARQDRPTDLEATGLIRPNPQAVWQHLPALVHAKAAFRPSLVHALSGCSFHGAATARGRKPPSTAACRAPLGLTADRADARVPVRRFRRCVAPRRDCAMPGPA